MFKLPPISSRVASLCAFDLIRRAFPNSRTILLGAAGLTLSACLMACTPAFDWRSVTNTDGGFSATYPAKPASDERSVQIAGQSLRMQMQSARVGDVVFAVGVVMLPDDTPALQAAVLDYLQQGLARNIGVAPQVQAARIQLDATGQSIPATQFAASGIVPDSKHEHRFMSARFAARGARVYEVVIVAPTEPATEQVDQFFDSFKLF